MPQYPPQLPHGPTLPGEWAGQVTAGLGKCETLPQATSWGQRAVGDLLIDREGSTYCITKTVLLRTVQFKRGAYFTGPWKSTMSPLVHEPWHLEIQSGQ